MRTICLTLPETPERTDKALAHFKEAGVENVELFYGINAEVAGLSTTHTYEIDNPGTNFRMGTKPTGIWLSHYMLLNALTLCVDEHVLILEVDAKFLPDWKERFERAMADVPKDFDMLYLGSCCTQGQPMEKVGRELFVTRPQCNHAYVVAKKCLPFIVKTLRKCWAPVDIHLLFDCQPHLKVYTLLPRCVEQFDTEIPH